MCALQDLDVSEEGRPETPGDPFHIIDNSSRNMKPCGLADVGKPR